MQYPVNLNIKSCDCVILKGRNNVTVVRCIHVHWMLKLYLLKQDKEMLL